MRFTNNVADPQEEVDYPDRPILDKVQMETKAAALAAVSPKTLQGVFMEVGRRSDEIQAKQEAKAKEKADKQKAKEADSLNMQSGGLDGPDLFF